MNKHFYIIELDLDPQDPRQEIAEPSQEEIAAYLEGEVYGYRIFNITPEFEERYQEDLAQISLQDFVDEIADSGWLAREEYDKQIEETDSCWGFYGRSYCQEEAQAVVKYQEEHWQEYQDRKSGQQQLPLT